MPEDEREGGTEVEVSGTRNAIEWIVVIAIALAMALCLRILVFEPFVIPSGSMEDTIAVGDRVIGEKVTLHVQDPTRGDIVTFSDPEGGPTPLIKRVIATAGQVVDLRDGYVYVDGEALHEPYTDGKPSYPLPAHGTNLQEDVSFPYTVPDGCLWVMGDNRTNSLDSRFFGAIPVSSVTSKALFVFWPLEHVGAI